RIRTRPTSLPKRVGSWLRCWVRWESLRDRDAADRMVAAAPRNPGSSGRRTRRDQPRLALDAVRLGGVARAQAALPFGLGRTSGGFLRAGPGARDGTSELA